MGRHRRPYIVFRNYVNVWVPVRNLVYIYIYIYIYISRGLERAERTCGECDLGKVEDVQHWLLECERWKDERVDLFQSLSRVALGFDLMTDDDKLFAILDQGCKHHSILKIILKMWTARFS